MKPVGHHIHIFLGESNKSLMCTDKLPLNNCMHEESLATSNQQFGYKANLSTIMCSSLVIETILYFESKCSPTCVLFIDASKAFDRVRHIDLFNVLSKRNMCALVRRLLMTMYSDQRIQVR